MKLHSRSPGKGPLSLLGLFLAALLLVLSCSGGGTGPSATLTDLGSIEDLRVLFNRDAGSPRIVILVSPT